MSIEPTNLCGELAAGEVVPGQVRIWWQGQLSYALRGSAGTVLIDPFLTPMERRLVKPPFGVGDLVDLDAILVTHEHSDHLDARTVVAALERFPDLRVIVPEPLADGLRKLTAYGGRIIGTQPGQTTDVGAIRVHAIPAFHGIDFSDAYSYGKELSGGLFRYLGYVVELGGGVTVLDTGDTLVTDEIIDAVRALGLPIDVALLPINGRDHFREKRNLVGNMDHREAAMFASAIDAELLIPGHYDMFHDNRGFPGHLIDFVDRFHPDLHVAILSKHRTFNHMRGGRP